MAKQSNYNPDGNLVVRGNIVGDENIYITGNAVITGTLSVTGEATYSSDTVTLNAADGYVINSNSDVTSAFLQINNNSSNVQLTYDSSGSLIVSKPTTFNENVTLSAGKTLSAPLLTDGTASITGGVGTGFTNITSTLFTGTVDGTATTAGNLQSDRTLSLTGPITGSVALGLNANTSAPSMATTITNNSVTLGTHTTGNYVATITGGTGLTSTATTGEGSTPTINLDNTASDMTGSTYGTASSTPEFTVDRQGRLLTAGTNAIQIGSSQLTNFDTEVRGNISVTDSGGDGSLSYNNSTGVITYTGPSASDTRAHFTGGTGITISSGTITTTDGDIVHDNLSGFVANEHIDHTTVSVTAGTGLTGGGTIASTRTLNVIGGDGITANANDIEVDSTVVRTTGNQSLAGTKTFSGSLVVPTLTTPSNPSGNAYVSGDSGGSTKAASTAYVEAAIDALVGGAPGTLDTLNEIAEALNDDDDAIVTLTNSKVSKSGDSMTGALAMGSNKITNVANATDPQDVTTLAQVGVIESDLRTYVNTRDDTKVDKTETIASTSFYFAPTSSNFGTDTSIDYSTTGGIKFTPILTGTAEAVLVQGNQTPDYTQKRHGQLTITGDLTLQPGIENNTSAPTSQRGAGSLTVGGNTLFISENKGVEFDANNSANIIIGKTYQITDPGTTDFTLMGAADSNVGTQFVATSVGSGTGKVEQPSKTFLSNYTTAFYKHTVGTGQSALFILGGNLYYSTKASEVDTYIVSETSGAGTIGQHASDTSNTTLQAKSLGVDRAHFQSFGNSTMFIGNIAQIADYTTVSYQGNTYTTGTRPLERLTVDGGVIMGPRTGDDELLVNGTIFFDAGVFKVIEGGIIKQVTTSSTSDLFFTSTGTNRVEVGKEVGGDYYFPALGPDSVNSISISTAGNVTANVTTLSANLDLVKNTAISNISVGAPASPGGNGSLAYNNTTGVFTLTPADTGLSTKDTDDLSEGSTNLYYTDARSRGAISVSGDLSYNSSTGVISFTNDLGDIESVTAGTGLTGGGTSGAVTLNADQSYIRGSVSASGTLSYNSGTGVFTSSADNYSSWNFTTDSAGNEAVSSAELVTFVGGNNMDVTHSGNTITIATNADVTGVVAGTGMTGGGTTGDVTVNVIGGDGITANANDVAVDSTVVRTSGNQTIAGNKTLSGSTQIDALSIAGNYDLPTADGSANEVLTTDGAGNLTFADVTTIGGTITGVTAGSGLTGGGVAGTVTLNVVGGTGIVANANDIAIDFSEFDTANITEGTNLYYTTSRANTDFDTRLGTKDTADLTEGTNLYFTAARARGNISAGGDLSYNSTTGVMSYTTPTMYADSDARSAISVTDAGGLGSASYNSGTGVITYTGPSNADIRGLFSASGDISYNSSTGAFSFTDSDTVGTVTNVTVGTGLDVSNGTTTPSISLDLSELTDMTAAVVGTQDELILLDNGAERRKLISEITLSDFSNDSGWTTNTGTVTSVSGGSGLTGTVTTSGSLAVGAGTGITVNADNVAVDMGDFSTSDLSEGTNLYYTNSRVDARITKTAIDALNVDADTLDSISSGSFLRSDAADTHTHTITPNADNSIDLGSTGLRYNEVHAVTFKGVATSAQYADLAENYVADSEYPVGTVLVLGGSEEVTVTDVPNSPKVAGVVSTDPAYLMNAGQSGNYVVSVALRGRVPVRTEGVVNKGDVLVTSATPGVAMVGSDPHFIGAACIIGKAITSKTHGAEGIVEVLI